MLAKQKQLYASVTQNKLIDETFVVARPESTKSMITNLLQQERPSCREKEGQ
jgi:hypothetical protein